MAALPFDSPPGQPWITPRIKPLRRVVVTPRCQIAGEADEEFPIPAG
jgi:hypothetical protein